MTPPTATRALDAGPTAVAGSFRDPRSRVFVHGGQVLRGLDAAGAADFAHLEQTAFYRDALADGSIVATERAAPDAHADLRAQGWDEVLVHHRVPTITHPYEWSFSMLRDAALLQLDLVRRGLADGVSCKDGTPYNVQFVGSSPVFIDVGSFEPVRADAWPGYRQFCCQYLYPLLIEAYLEVPFAPWLRGSLEGITPDEAARLLRGRARFRPGVLTHVSIQAAVARRYADRPDPARAVVQGQRASVDIATALVRRLTRLVAGLRAPGGASTWSGYSDRSHYDPAALTDKDRFVIEALEAADPDTVVDLGCNDGRYAEMAAAAGARVVAVDADRRVVDRLYVHLRGATDILPVVGDLADPSPALGWGLEERAALPERLHADVALSLALIHHLVIGRNIPIDRYLDALAELAPRTVLEVPHRDDPMVQKLLAPKPPDTHRDYDLDVIAARIAERFEVVRTHRLPGGTRTIFELARR